MSSFGYTSPGVSVTETISPSLAPLLANPALIVLVGQASGFQSATERISISTTPTQLKFTGVNTSTVVVKDSITNSVLNAGTYKVAAGTDPDPSVSGDIPYSLSLVPAPSTAPTVSNAGTGTLVGSYVYAVSFVNGAGETGIGPASAIVSLSTAGTNLTNIPVDASSGNTTSARNIYRAPVVSSVVGTYTLVATLGNNSATTLSNETAAAGSTLPPVDVASGATVLVSYNYTNQDYYRPTIFDSYNDIAAKYGAPFDSTGAISSPLSFAARIAFQNGASEMMLLSSASGSDSDIESAFNLLIAEDEARIIVPVSGSAAVHTSLAAHCASANTNGFYRQGIVGRDGATGTPVDAPTLRSAAKALNNESIILVSPASFKMQNPITGRDMYVGGQYAAAAVAGMFAARDVQYPLTRKTVGGFSDLGVKLTPTEQALNSQAGLMEIISQGGVLLVRHGVTTAIGNVNTAEASVVRSKYELAHRLRSTLDSSVVGTVLPVSNAALTVAQVITGILEQLQVEGSISLYGNVAARVLDTDPTTVEGSFMYRPAYPINNIVVNFTIDSSSGDFSLTTT